MSKSEAFFPSLFVNEQAVAKISSNKAEITPANGLNSSAESMNAKKAAHCNRDVSKTPLTARNGGT